MAALGFPELIIIMVALAGLAFELAMLISMLRNNRLSGISKVAWAFGFIFLQLFAAGAYYFTSYSGKYGLKKAPA